MNRLTTSAARSPGYLQIAAVAAFSAMCATFGLFSMPPLDRDEARFAQATAQMLETGDFINIRFQDAERNKKPAGAYWIQAASVSAFSSVESREIWAYRMPSVVAAVLAAVFTYAAGARLYNPSVGLIAGLLLAAAPAVAAEGSIAKTDALLLACVTMAQAALVFVYGSREERPARSWTWPLVFWTAIGAGILIKGPIIILIVGFTGAALTLRERSLRWISRLRPVAGFLIVALMTVPWAIAISAATEGRFFSQAVGGDMIAKIGTAQESHGAPPGYYTLLVFVLFWPAAAILLPGIRQALATRKSWPSYFLLAWLIPSWVVFEMTATKLPHYTLPLYPSLAIMAARAIQSGSAARWVILRKTGALAFVAIGLIVAGLTPYLAAKYGPSALMAPAAMFAVLIGVGSIWTGVFFWRSRLIAASFGAVIMSAILAFALLNSILPRLDRLAVSSRINDIVRTAGLHSLHNHANPTVLAGYFEPSAVFLLGTDTLLTDGGNAAREIFYGMHAIAIVEEREHATFIASLEKLGAHVDAIGEVEGLNYSNGHEVKLTVYKLADERAQDWVDAGD
jgi:4-amino-4-deoxy-L-arabinose transferase-like glycosyltransferase